MHLKYEVDHLWNKDVTVKNIFDIYFIFEVDTLRNEKVVVKHNIFLSSRGDKSEYIGARVINLVTWHVVDDKEHIFEVWSWYLKKLEMCP
jgi:hypothetical protein